MVFCESIFRESVGKSICCSKKRTMAKKITLTVNRSHFKLELEDAFADYLLAQMKRDFNLEANNDIRLLLQAYVQKNLECFEMEKKAESVLREIVGSGK